MRYFKESMFDQSNKGSKFKNIRNGNVVELVNRCESLSSIGWECKHLEGTYKDANFLFWVSDLSLQQAYEKV